MLMNSRTGRCCPLDTYWKRLGMLVAFSLTLPIVIVGCGDEAAPAPQVVLEVQAPVS